MALADGPLAEPLGEKKYFESGKIFNYLKRVCDEQSIDKIVIGLPEGKVAETVKKFGRSWKNLPEKKFFIMMKLYPARKPKVN